MIRSPGQGADRRTPRRGSRSSPRSAARPPHQARAGWTVLLRCSSQRRASSTHLWTPSTDAAAPARPEGRGDGVMAAGLAPPFPPWAQERSRFSVRLGGPTASGPAWQAPSHTAPAVWADGGCRLAEESRQLRGCAAAFWYAGRRGLPLAAEPCGVRAW